MQQPAWRKYADKVFAAAAGNPLFQKFSAANNPVLQKATDKVRDLRETLQEKWETSDSPLVHRIENISNSVFQAS